MLTNIKNIIDIINDLQNKDPETADALAEEVRGILWHLSATINAPSNWRDIPEIIEKQYKDNGYIYETLSLWNYEEE